MSQPNDAPSQEQAIHLSRIVGLRWLAIGCPLSKPVWESFTNWTELRVLKILPAFKQIQVIGFGGMCNRFNESWFEELACLLPSLAVTRVDINADSWWRASTAKKQGVLSGAFGQALAGFAAGAVSTGVLHPLDVVKTRSPAFPPAFKVVGEPHSQSTAAGVNLRSHLAVDESSRRGASGYGLRGTVNTFRMIQAQDGIKGLYRGLGANLAGACFSWG
ncbi:hypothetical protein BC830DRAFT_1223604, partial [Chytriomyces sp. MP71]